MTAVPKVYPEAEACDALQDEVESLAISIRFGQQLEGGTWDDDVSTILMSSACRQTRKRLRSSGISRKGSEEGHERCQQVPLSRR